MREFHHIVPQRQACPSRVAGLSPTTSAWGSPLPRAACYLAAARHYVQPTRWRTHVLSPIGPTFYHIPGATGLGGGATPQCLSRPAHPRSDRRPWPPLANPDSSPLDSSSLRTSCAPTKDATLGLDACSAAPKLGDGSEIRPAGRSVSRRKGGSIRGAKVVGPLIRARREAQGLSQAELAAQTGLAQTYVSRIERGAVPRPRPATLRKLGDALGLRLPEFYQSAGALDLPPPADTTPFGSWLRGMIVARGFASEREFAAQAGIAPKHLSRLLTGDIKRPTHQVMWRLAGALQVPLAEVVERARRPAGDAADTGQYADVATDALVALLDHLQEEPEVMARLDALGTPEKALLRDIADLLTVYLRGVLRAQAARSRPRNGTSPD